MALFKWGRNESLVFPPQKPVYFIGTLVAILVATAYVIFSGSFMGLTPIARAYYPLYMNVSAKAHYKPSAVGEYRLICISNGKTTKIATAEDVIVGDTELDDGSHLPLEASEAAASRGFVYVTKGPKTNLLLTPFRSYLRLAFFKRRSARTFLIKGAEYGVAMAIICLPIAFYFDMKRMRMWRYGRRLKGVEKCTPWQFNDAVNGDGIAFWVKETRWLRWPRKVALRVPRDTENRHFELIADSGKGKTTLIYQILQQVAERGEAAIVYDPAMEFIKRFYDPERGDIILNPLDKRCPYWVGPAIELRHSAEARSLAASLFQPKDKDRHEFFTETPQKIFAHLLRFGPSPAEIADWMANPDEIDKRVKGTELAQFIAKSAPTQRAGVLASLGLVAEGLRLLPTPEESRQTWCATEWCKERKGWIFISSKPTVREALLPLESLWIDWLILRLMDDPGGSNNKSVWIILDELYSLQRLPKLATAITEGRKSNMSIVMATQAASLVEKIYGDEWKALLSGPATKVFLGNAEKFSAEWVSSTLGDVEIEQVKESIHKGHNSGSNYTLERKSEPAYMPSEIHGIPKFHGLMMHGNHVVNFSFEYQQMPTDTEAFIPRLGHAAGLMFDPDSAYKQISDRIRLLNKTVEDANVEFIEAQCKKDSNQIIVSSNPKEVLTTGEIEPTTETPSFDGFEAEPDAEADEVHDVSVSEDDQPSLEQF